MPTIVARLLLCMGFFAHSLAVARADEAALHQHMDLFGNYELSPGQVLTGGPWEDGQVLFMEATNIADGGVFTRADADSFESVFPPGKSFRVVRDAAGDVTALDWQAGAGSTVRAQRVHPQAREDVSIESGDVTLSGSLFLPVGPGPHPCIVLVHGSGDSDRYMGPWVTFFLQSGVGVFTYDKRGVGLSTGDWRDGSYAALADDAVAAVEYLASRDDVDAGRIGIHGSSEGGWVAPLAATRSSHVSFLIVRVGPGQPVAETVLYEMRWDLREKNLTGEELEQVIGLSRSIFDAASRGDAWESLHAIVDPVRDTAWYRKAYGSGGPRGGGERMWNWHVANVHVDPAASVRQLDIPVLWFLAEQDENVDTAASEPLLRAAFEAAPTTDHELRVLPGANHAFFVMRDGQPSYTLGYWDAMAEWLASRGWASE